MEIAKRIQPFMHNAHIHIGRKVVNEPRIYTIMMGNFKTVTRSPHVANKTAIATLISNRSSCHHCHSISSDCYARKEKRRTTQRDLIAKDSECAH